MIIWEVNKCTWNEHLYINCITSLFQMFVCSIDYFQVGITISLSSITFFSLDLL